jgi:hypothetical protein
VTARDIERWRAALTVCPRTNNKLVTVLHGICRRAARLGPERQPGTQR